MLRNRPRLGGILTGLAVTAVSTVYFFAFDGGRLLELRAFDWRIRNCNDLEPASPIVHVDIDDGALERVGRWPWPRRRLADLVSTLSTLGARYIIIDLLLSEHEPPYFDDPRFGPYSDVEPGVDILGELSEENRVFGDLELADAIRAAGNVYLAAQFNVVGPREPDPLPERLRSWWQQDRSLTPEQAIAALHLSDEPEELAHVRREVLRLRLSDALLENFTLTETQLSERLQAPLAEVSAVLAGVKTDVAVELVGRSFAAGLPPTIDIVLHSILGDAKDRHNADRADILAAYRHHEGLAAVLASSYPAPAGIRSRLYRAFDAVPPYFALVQAARGIGAVNFAPDFDGGVRRVPIVVDYHGRVIPHLGLAVACDALGLDLDHLILSNDGRLTVSGDKAASLREAPLDEDGKLIINWAYTAKNWRRGEDFPHISAAKLLSLADKQREIEANETTVDYLLADVVALAKGEIEVTTTTAPNDGAAVRTDSAYRRMVNEHLALRRRARLAGLRQGLSPDEARRLSDRADQLLRDIQEQQRLAVQTVEANCRELQDVPPEEIAADPELRETARLNRRAKNLIDTDIVRYKQANDALAQAQRDLLADLKPRIADKIAFIGFAATAAGDIITTPIDPRTNGIMCHAHVLNSFLQGRFIKPRDRLLDAAICVALGIIAGVITAVRGPWLALLSVLGLMLAYALQNGYVLFLRLDRWVALTGTMITMAAAWAVVTLLRQLTAERERRFFAKQLGQYTAPAIAARIAESPEAAQAFKSVQTREVTCFFSDLKGFTTITEEESAELIQYVLNTYLERMSRVIWSSHGLINKFMGDGVMAFFNASVDPLPDHPAAACETSLRTLAELEKLKTEQRGRPASRIFDRLQMRVGLASGPCLNGDMGSELKADYTVIGDVVNLAARLEPANKVFGTQLMISGPTRDAVADRYEFRYLAELQVKGKAKTVPVFELICRKGDLTDEQREYIRRFEAGVELYKERRWDECIVHFTRILARRVDDLGASRYIDACQELKTFPPEDDWPGALELKEK